MEELGIILFKSEKNYPYKKYKDLYVLTGEDIILNVDEEEEGYIMKLRDDDTVKVVNVSAKDLVSEIALNLMLIALNKEPKRKELMEYRDPIEIAVECSYDNVLLSIYNMAVKRLLIPEENFIPIPITSSDNAEKLLSLKDKLNDPKLLVGYDNSIEGVFLKDKFYYQTSLYSVNLPSISFQSVNVNYGVYGKIDNEINEYLFIGDSIEDTITSKIETPIFIFFDENGGNILRTNEIIPQKTVEYIVRTTYDYILKEAQLILPEVVAILLDKDIYNNITKNIAKANVEFLTNNTDVIEKAKSKWLTPNIIFRVSFIGGKIFVIDNVNGSMYIQSFNKRIIGKNIPQLYSRFKEKNEINVVHSKFVKIF